MSKVFFENLLKSFKRSNKTRRQKLAEKAGYSTADEYLKFLQDNINGTPETVEEEVELTDLVIAFDTTGSMSSYIQSVKNHVSALIPNMFSDNPNLRISIVAFGDYCDIPRIHSKFDLRNGDFGKAYQVCPLTDNQQVLIDFVRGAQSTGGGDADEFYELVIRKVREETDWREGATKSMLLIGDCLGHGINYVYKNFTPRVSIDDELAKSAALELKIDTLSIQSHGVEFRFYQKISNSTGGICLPFSSSEKTQHLVRATGLARGGKNTKEKFKTMSSSKEITGDAELSATYSAYKTIIK